MSESIDRIIETFEFLTEWEDRYNYLAELGAKLPPLPDSDKISDNQVHACMSQVWITVQSNDANPPRLEFQGDSDTAIIKGIVAVLLALYSGHTPEQALAIDTDAIFDRLGIYDHLSPNRHVGVYAMVEKFRALASEHASLAA